MKRLVRIGEHRVDPRTSFAVAWVASFLGLVAILGLVYFAMYALAADRFH